MEGFYSPFETGMDFSNLFRKDNPSRPHLDSQGSDIQSDSNDFDTIIPQFTNLDFNIRSPNVSRVVSNDRLSTPPIYDASYNAFNIPSSHETHLQSNFNNPPYVNEIPLTTPDKQKIRQYTPTETCNAPIKSTPTSSIQLTTPQFCTAFPYYIVDLSVPQTPFRKLRPSSVHGNHPLDLSSKTARNLTPAFNTLHNSNIDFENDLDPRLPTVPRNHDDRSESPPKRRRQSPPSSVANTSPHSFYKNSSQTTSQRSVDARTLSPFRSTHTSDVPNSKLFRPLTPSPLTEANHVNHPVDSPSTELYDPFRTNRPPIFDPFKSTVSPCINESSGTSWYEWTPSGSSSDVNSPRTPFSPNSTSPTSPTTKFEFDSPYGSWSTATDDVSETRMPATNGETQQDINEIIAENVYRYRKQQQSLKTPITSTECRFCKQNGERRSFYMTHMTKDITGIVTCPVLRSYVCPFCHATGDYAHTRQYCPLNWAEKRETATAKALRAGRNCCGKKKTPNFFQTEI